jgi:CHAT domain-containing protein/tetratricopeptide (TPR) repeat protein
VRHEQWQAKLQALVDGLLEQESPSQELVANCMEVARSCDAGVEGDVNFALSQLFRIVDRFHGSDVAQVALDGAMNLAFASLHATAKPRNVLGLAKRLQERGMNDESLSLLHQAAALDVGRPEDGGPPAAAELLNYMGEVLRNLGGLSDAGRAFQAALAALEGGPASYDSERAVILNNLGLVHSAKGDLSEARKCLLETLVIDERLGTDSLSIAITLDNLGNIEAKLADQAGPLEMDGFINQAADELLRQAEHHFEEAEKRFESRRPQSSNDLIISLSNHAAAAAQRGDRDKREELSRRAFEIVETERVSVDAIWAAVTLRGEVLLESGESGAAAELLSSSYKRLVPQMEPSEGMSNGLTTLVRAAAGVHAQGLVEDVARMIADIDAELLPRALLGGSESETRHMFAGFKDRADLVVGHCLPATPSGIAPSWVYELVLNRKGVLAERQGSAWLHARLLQGGSAELLDRVRQQRSEVARLDLDGSDDEAIQVARRRHEEADRRLSQAEEQLQLELGGVTVPRLTVEDVQACLEPDTLLLDFVMAIRPDGSDHFVLFLVRSEDPIRFKDLGPVDEIGGRLDALKSISATPPIDEGADRRQEISATLELVPLLFEPDEVVEKHVLVAPTGSWGSFPFCLLPDEAGKPLIDGHTVTLVPSARWIVASATSPEKDATRGPSVVFGDPDFDLQLSDDVASLAPRLIPRLEHTGDEARAVAALLGVAPLVRGDAIRQRLLDVHGPRILHVASHGDFLEAIGSQAEQAEPRESMLRVVAGTVVSEDSNDLGWSKAAEDDIPGDAKAPQSGRYRWLTEIGPAGQLSRSALLLAGFNAWLVGVATSPEVGTGMLSAGEFALLDLATTELVVLSACKTGVGAVDYADGSLLGLRAAALSAGATSCVSTLWEVEDEAAATLVSTFYRHLTSGVGRASSLREAQLALRETHPDPFFWAGWVVEGASGPISANS